MWGRKAKRIKELEGEINKATLSILDSLEAMDLLRAKEPPVSLAPVHFDITDHWGEPLEWIDGEPKENGFYFVATNKWAAQGYETTALFYNPAARCRWMRGDQGNSERFEGEVVAHIKAPEYRG